MRSDISSCSFVPFLPTPDYCCCSACFASCELQIIDASVPVLASCKLQIIVAWVASDRFAFA